MDNIEVTVTRELDVEELYHDLLYWIPEWDTINQAGMDETDLDEEMIYKILKALVRYMEEKNEE